MRVIDALWYKAVSKLGRARARRVGMSYFSIRRTVIQSFNQMANEAFAGIDNGLRYSSLDRVNRMRQAAQLVVNIPERGPLIAEQDCRLSAQNASQPEREQLDYINGIVGTTFTAALNANAAAVAESRPVAMEFTQGFERVSLSIGGSEKVDRASVSIEETGSMVYGFLRPALPVAVVPLVFKTDANSQAASARQAHC